MLVFASLKAKEKGARSKSWNTGREFRKWWFISVSLLDASFITISSKYFRRALMKAKASLVVNKISEELTIVTSKQTEFKPQLYV